MLTADLNAGNIAMFAPFEGASLRTPPGHAYDVMVRHPGQTGWHYGVTAENAATAWACLNYIRRTWDSRVQVKLLAKPAA